MRCQARGMRPRHLPRACVLCGTQPIPDYFCRGCRSDLPWIGDACGRCGQPLAAALPDGTACAACQARPPAFARACAPLLYAFPVDAALGALKFRRRLFYAPAFGSLLPPLHGELFADADALLPVPLHTRRHAVRGFNQATELCRELRRTSGLPIISNVRRRKFTRPQTGLGAAARRRNMKAAFELRGVLCYRRPLLIDDVITTGETCHQLARTLLAEGAESVGVLAVARAALP